MFEKKKGKRFLASVMALVMLLSLAPVGTLAAENEEQNQDVVALPADGDNQQAVADTPKEDTPTPQPAVADPVESSSEADILPEGYLFDQAFGVNHDTSNSNDIAEHKGGNKGDGEPVTTDSTTKYVIRFYVSQTGTENSYTEENKYTVVNQPDSNEEEDNLELSVSPGYAILTGYNDVATEIDWQNFTQVNETGDEAVKAWLNQHASKGVPAGLTDSATVNEIVKQINKQYRENNKGYDLPELTENYFNGFEFVEAKYVGSGESSIHVHVKLIRKPEYVTRTVRYMANDGTNREDRDSDFYEENTTATATVKENMFTRAGYEFTGWNTQADGNGTHYSPKTSIQFDNHTDVTLYAQWTPQTYQINYELYSGTNANINPTSYTYGEGVSSFAPATKDNYNFEGWYSEPEFKNKVENISTTDTGNKTLYAKWTAQTATTKTQAMYFVLLPNRGTPKNNADQGEANYLPSSKSNGGAIGRDESNGYDGYLTKAGKEALEAATSKSITNIKDGVPKEYLSAPSDLGFFNPSNWKNGSYKDSSADISMLGENFNVNGIQIVWYTIKNQGDGIHVDGYVKNVAVNVTYHSNFDPDTPYTDATTTGTNYSAKCYTETGLPERSGYTFAGWYTEASCDNAYTGGVLMSNLHLYAKWTPKQYKVSYSFISGTTGEELPTEVTNQLPAETQKLNGSEVIAPTSFTSVEVKGANDVVIGTWNFERWNHEKQTVNGQDISFEGTWIYTVAPGEWKYTVNQHFINAKGEKTDRGTSVTVADTTVTTLQDSIPDGMQQNQNFGDPAQNYVYIAKETTYQVNSEKKNASDSLANGAVIDLYYYLDVIGEKDEKGNDKGDEIPDCYQVTIIYKSSDERRGKISDASLKKEVLTIKDEEGNRLSSGKVEITGASAEVTGSRCYFVNWTKKQEGTTDVSTVTSSANLTAQTFNAKGGDVYTFTANFDRSSGGGGGGSRPTVTIPDDVPTGLNGKDHYAYIIGYGNNDVRPQNNITRAEVATIFFRLLTDETREANMTKSNGYNDVKDGDWFCCAVSTLSKMGIIKGYEDGSFKPNDPISRAEFAAIAARFDPDGDKTPATFADVTSHWAKDEISIAANHGWIKGYEDGSFKPDQKITRAETMTLVNRVLNRLPETKDDLHKDMKTWVDNMDETAWYYLAVQEATNSHYFKNKTGTKFEQWTDLRDTRDWSELEK